MGSKKKKKELRRQQKAEQKSNIKHHSKPVDKNNKTKIWILLGILIFTFICFSPSLNNGFVNWDDDRNFVENEYITTLTQDNFWSNTIAIFKSDVIGGYNPLTIWTFLIEQKLYGLDNPMMWHLDNILLHLVCTFFVFWIGFRLRLGLIGATMLALLFGVHPLRVESVAWVTERKDVLFGAFYLAALFYYIKGKQEGFNWKLSLIIGICFVLSLLSKIQAVILPLSLILVDYYLSDDHRISIKQALKKWPYFIASLAVGLLGIYFLKDEGSTDQAYEGIVRLFIGSFSLLVYYVKSIVPYEISPLYPYPASIEWYFYASIISFIATAYILIKAYTKKWSVWFFGIGFFIVNVFLLLQILGAGQGFLADRFTYIPYFGLFFIMAFYIEKLISRKPKFKNAIFGLCAIVILAFGFMNFQLNKIWKNSDTLWTHVLKYYDKTPLPWGNRANYYRDNGQTAKALHDYGQVIRIKPKKPEAYNSRARLYFNFNNRDSLLKALQNYNIAINLKPDDVEYIVNRGATYAKLGDMNNALQNLNQAEKLDPKFANTYLNRSVIYSNGQDNPKALADIDKYLELKPYHADMWYEKSRLHLLLEEIPASLEAANKAIRINPNKGIYYFERAKANLILQQVAQAKSDVQQSIRLGYKGDQNVINRILNAK